MANESLTLSMGSSNLSFSAKSSLSNIVEDKSMKWVFVGGKGGVGKTTVSCCLALTLAESRRVLLVSTDPAHNVSDAFCRQFGKTPKPLKEMPDLSVMEMDPDSLMEKLAKTERQYVEKARSFLSRFPGVKETLALAEIIYRTRDDEYGTVLFDTAPTGHTIGLLSFLLGVSKSSFSKSSFEIPERFGFPADILDTFCDDALAMVEFAIRQLKEPTLTTFVCVCTADFLSIYETERLIQEIAKAGVDCRNIVVNQLLEGQQNCKCCGSKSKIQSDYLRHVYELYEGFHITELPSVNDELRGIAQLKLFSNFLTQI